MIHGSGIKTVYGCSVIVNVSFVYKMYFYSPGLCFFIVLPRFFQIFSIFLFIFISKRHNPWDILFFIFSPVFLFSGGFSLIFLFYRPSCTFSVFYRFIWFHYNFSVFMLLIFFELYQGLIKKNLSVHMDKLQYFLHLLYFVHLIFLLLLY